MSEGQTIDVELLAVDPGSAVELDQVLAVVDGERVMVGQPTVAGAKVVAQVLGEVKGPKIVVFKYKPKTRYRKKTGHRQRYTRLTIKSIELVTVQAPRRRRRTSPTAEETSDGP